MIGPIALLFDLVFWVIVVLACWLGSYSHWRCAGHSRFFPVVVLVAMGLATQMGLGGQVGLILIVVLVLLVCSTLRKSYPVTPFVSVIFTSCAAAFLWTILAHQAISYIEMRSLKVQDVRSVTLELDLHESGKCGEYCEGSQWCKMVHL